MQSFSIRAALTFGWEKFKAHFIFLWMILGIILGINILFGLLGKTVGEESMAYTLVSIASGIVSIILQVGAIRIYLNLTDTGTEDKVSVLFSQTKFFWRYLGANILYALIVMVGFLLLIVPGIYFALKYQFSRYLIVDKDMGVIQSLKESDQIADGAKWDLLLFMIVMMGINIIGACAFLVGLLITVPVSIMASLYVYRELSKKIMPMVTEPAPSSPATPLT